MTDGTADDGTADREGAAGGRPDVDGGGTTRDDQDGGGTTGAALDDQDGGGNGSLAGTDLASVLSALPDSTFVVDGDGRFLWWNDAVTSVTGYDHDEVAAMNAIELVAPERRDDAAEVVRRVVETGGVETVETEVLTADGEHIPTEFKLRRVSHGDRRLVVGIGRNVADRRERRRDLRLYETAVEAAPDSIYALDGDHRFRMANERFVESIGIPRDDLLGDHISVVADAGVVDDAVIEEAESVLSELRETDRESVRLESTAAVARGERFVENNFAVVTGDADRGTVVNVARDVTARVDRERELERRRDELATLDDVNALVQETIRALVGAANRTDIERTVCERLAESPRYRAVWTTERVSGALEPRIVAGARGYVDAVTGVSTTGEEWTDLVEPVAESSSVVASDLSEPELPEQLRAAAREYDVGSGIAVPLSYGDVVYGALVVNAAAPDAFSRRERAAFETLGRAMGLAVNAARHRRLTFSDAAVALQFRATGTHDFFVDATEALDCRIELEGMVPVSEDEVVVYLSISGAGPEQVAPWADASERVVDWRPVSTDGDGGTIETVLSDSPAKRLQDTGATVREAFAENGVAEVVAEVAPGEDVREVVETVTEGYEGVEFVARRDVERSASAGPASLSDRLTDRQQSALRAAFLAGYYDWPRGSTAEEVAEALGVTPPTLHQHLRAAESKLVSSFFGAGDGDT